MGKLRFLLAFLACILFGNWCTFGANSAEFKVPKPSSPCKSRVSVILRLHGWEQQHVADGAAIRQQHNHSVNAVADTTRGGHCWAKAQRDKGFQTLTISTKASIIHPSTPLERS